MKSVNRIILLTTIVLFSGIFVSNAQIIVNVRPERPHYERVIRPGPRHVWIEEEWEPRGGAYVFVGGHWMEPPHPGWIWVPGHWKEGPRGGWFWRPGHWRHR